jgi:hypothetical protein
MLPYHHQLVLGDGFPLQHQYLERWEAPSTSPDITYQQNSLSPSAASPVTPQSKDDPNTVSHNKTQSFHNVIGSYETSEFDTARLEHWKPGRYSTAVTFGFAATPSSHEAPFCTGHSSVYTDTQSSCSYHHTPLQSRCISASQRYENARPHNHTLVNTSHGMLDKYELNPYSNHGANGWALAEEVNSEPYGQQLVDTGDSPMQPLLGDTTQQIPIEPSSSYVYDSSPYGDQIFNMGGFASSVNSKVLSIKCEHCLKAFTGKFRLGNRKRHIKNMHDPSRPEFPFGCQLCLHKYKRDDALLKHCQEKHPLEYPEPKPRGRNARALTVHGRFR